MFIPAARKAYRSADVDFDETLFPGITAASLGLSKKERDSEQDIA